MFSLEKRVCRVACEFKKNGCDGPCSKRDGVSVCGDDPTVVGALRDSVYLY